MLKDYLLKGILSGFLGGIILGILTVAVVTPVILKAEVFEEAAEPAEAAPAAAHHDHADHHHDHGAAAAEPSLVERFLLTTVGTSLLGAAYGVLFAFIFFLSPDKSPRSALLLGGGVFLGLHLLPGLPVIGLPPNPPGVETLAPVEARQAWWLAVVIAEGFAAAVFLSVRERMAGRIGPAAIAAVAIVSLPFLYGAPNAIGGNVVPDEITFLFRAASYGVNFAFWLALAWLTERFTRGISSEVSQPAVA